MQRKPKLIRFSASFFALDWYSGSRGRAQNFRVVFEMVYYYCGEPPRVTLQTYIYVLAVSRLELLDIDWVFSAYRQRFRR